MDYYELLGVPKNASESELKKAYKKQSMQHHPDRNGGSDERFKQINEAYSALKDPQKRQMYDQYGTVDPQQANQFQQGGNGFHFDGRNMDDLFGSIFGQGFAQQRRPQRNSNITIACDITLAEVYSGKGVLATFKTRTGREQTVNIDIPKGSRHGDTIQYHGLGDDSISQLPKGDLLVKVRIIRDPKFDVNGFDLHTQTEIGVVDLILGTATNLSLPNGRTISINVPAGTQPGTTLSIHGQGLPNYNTGQAGNVYLNIRGIVPKNLTNEQKDILRKLV
tara:strand:- start:1983 stop:2816 length:834 start_codon:yes stop_codon:yes gene_type:complete